MPDHDPHHQAALAQGTAAHLAELLPRLTGEAWDDSEPVSVTEDHRIVMTHDQAWLLHDMARRSLPYCFAVEEGRSARDDCKMPDGVCYTCAAAGRSVPEEHPVRRSGTPHGESNS